MFFEESQHATWPQVRHILRWTQRSFIFKHSSQPAALGLTSRIWLRCVQDDCGMIVRLSHISLRYSCTNWTAIAPSPTAEATRLTESDRTSPAANTPARLVSSRNGSRLPVQCGYSASDGPDTMKPLASHTIHRRSQQVRGTAPIR